MERRHPLGLLEVRGLVFSSSSCFSLGTCCAGSNCQLACTRESRGPWLGIPLCLFIPVVLLVFRQMETFHFCLLSKLTLHNRLWLVSSELEETFAKEKSGSVAVLFVFWENWIGVLEGLLLAFPESSANACLPRWCQNPRLGERRLQ